MRGIAIIIGIVGIGCTYEIDQCNHVRENIESLGKTVDVGRTSNNGIETCVPLELFPLGISSDLEESLINDAIDYWSDQIGFDAFIKVPFGEHEIDVQFAPGGIKGARVGLASVESDYLTGIVLECNIFLERTTPDILYHELGHCLGLADDKGAGGIMDGTLNIGSNLTQHDLDLILSPNHD